MAVFDTEGNQVGNLNRQAIESHLRRRLDERYEDHAYFVKVNLGTAIHYGRLAN
jgi:hypothetical protein